MDAVGLIVPLLLQRISKLRTRYKNEKIFRKESVLLEDFINTIQRCISATKKVGASSSSTKKNSKPLPLVVTLTEVQKTLDEWSSEESRFFWIFTDRREELEALKVKVDRALRAHNTERIEEIYKQIFKESPPVKDSEGTSTGLQRRSASVEPRKVPRENQDGGSKDSNHEGPMRPRSRHHESKPKTLEPSKVHPKHREEGPKDSHRHEPSKENSKYRELGTKDSNQQSSSGSTHRQTKPETHTWVYLWAPIDSDKQAKDVENKLKNIQDVKVYCDQPIKKVMVEMKAVEVKDDSKIIQTLLRETRNALPSYKAPPTLWDNRPR